ncbi:MAG: glycosyltransferase family 4 protein [Candidatus Kariarchaeaceae archaeon]
MLNKTVNKATENISDPSQKIIGIIGPILSSSGTTTHVKNVIKGFLELEGWTPVLITYMEPNASVNIVKGPLVVTSSNDKPRTEVVLTLPSEKNIPEKTKEQDKELTLSHKIYIYDEEVTPAKFSSFGKFIASVIKKEEITILHPQIKPFALFCSVLAGKYLMKEEIIPPKIVGTWHSNFGWIKDAKYHLALANMSRPFIDGLIPVSQNVVDDLDTIYNFPRERIQEITPPGGIDLERVQIDRSSLMIELRKKYSLAKNYIIFLGRLLHNKGVDLLLESYKRLLSRGVDVSLVIVGTGPFKKEYVNEAIRLGFNVQTSSEGDKSLNDRIGQVIFTGFISDEEVYAFLQGAAVYCLPSRWESFSISILEAMGAGVPVVCTSVGGIPFWVGDSALLVPSENPEKLTEGLERVLSDAELVTTLIERSSKTANKYHWKNLIKRTAEEIQAVEMKEKPWNESISDYEGYYFDYKTGIIQVKDKQIMNEHNFKKRMLIDSYGLFFPSEALEERNYYQD